jgi:small subunit ribosomal protein S21
LKLAEVTAGEEESFDSLLKRFNRKVQQDGILAELRRREHYEKPSIKRKRKKAAKKRGAAKSARMYRR